MQTHTMTVKARVFTDEEENLVILGLKELVGKGGNISVDASRLVDEMVGR